MASQHHHGWGRNQQVLMLVVILVFAAMAALYDGDEKPEITIEPTEGSEELLFQVTSRRPINENEAVELIRSGFEEQRPDLEVVEVFVSIDPANHFRELFLVIARQRKPEKKISLYRSAQRPSRSSPRGSPFYTKTIEYKFFDLI